MTEKGQVAGIDRRFGGAVGGREAGSGKRGGDDEPQADTDGRERQVRRKAVLRASPEENRVSLPGLSQGNGVQEHRAGVHDRRLAARYGQRRPAAIRIRHDRRERGARARGADGLSASSAVESDGCPPGAASGDNERHRGHCAVRTVVRVGRSQSRGRQHFRRAELSYRTRARHA